VIDAGVPVRVLLKRKLDRHILVVTLIFGAWLLIVMLSPFLVPSGQLTDLSGAVFRIDNARKIEGINPIAWLIYSAGDFNCHQLRERSFFLNDNQMPFCARDVGLFFGAALGSLSSLLLVLRLKWQYVAFALIPFALDVAAQELTAYESTNELRVATGFIAGAACAIFICQKVEMPVEIKDAEERP